MPADYDFRVECGQDRFVYHPTAYSLCELWGNTSSKVKKVVDHLENFPEIGGRSLFDHYRVIAPSFEYRSPYRIADIDGKSLSFMSYGEVRKALDIIFLKNHLSASILLGEKDGEFYFICYWI